MGLVNPTLGPESLDHVRAQPDYRRIAVETLAAAAPGR